MAREKNITTLLFVLLVICGVLSRLLPHAPNATAITALAFVVGMYAGGWRTLYIPLGVMAFSDMVIGVYDWRIMLSVYGSFALISAISWMSRTHGVFTKVTALLSSSLLFFLVTNAAVWAFSPWYEKTFTGLMLSYELGIPFLKNMMFGDVAYTAGFVILCEAVFTLSRVLSTIHLPPLPLPYLKSNHPR